MDFPTQIIYGAFFTPVYPSVKDFNIARVVDVIRD